jgi:hypothetical protein
VFDFIWRWYIVFYNGEELYMNVAISFLVGVFFGSLFLLSRLGRIKRWMMHMPIGYFGISDVGGYHD